MLEWEFHSKERRKEEEKKVSVVILIESLLLFFYLFYFLWVYAIAVSKRVLKWCEFVVFLGWQIQQQRNQITFANFLNQLFQKILQKLIQKYLIKCNFFHPIWCVCVLISKTLYMRRWFQEKGEKSSKILKMEEHKKLSPSLFSVFLVSVFPLLLSLKYTTPVLGWKRQRRAMCEKHQMEQAIKWLSNSPQVPPRRSDRSKQTAD